MFSATKFFPRNDKTLSITNQPTNNDIVIGWQNYLVGAATWKVSPGWKRSAVAWEKSLDGVTWQRGFQPSNGFQDEGPDFPVVPDSGPWYVEDPWDPVWRLKNNMTRFPNAPAARSNRQDGAFFFPIEEQDLNLNAFRWRASAFTYPAITNLPNYPEGSQPYEFASNTGVAEGNFIIPNYDWGIINIPKRRQDFSFLFLKNAYFRMNLHLHFDGIGAEPFGEAGRHGVEVYENNYKTNWHSASLAEGGIDTRISGGTIESGSILKFEYWSESPELNTGYSVSLSLPPDTKFIHTPTMLYNDMGKRINVFSDPISLNFTQG